MAHKPGFAMSRLADFFRRRRLEFGLTTGDLARAAGYRNLSRGARRIVEFEREGRIHPDVLRRLQSVLGVDDETVSRLAMQDRRDHERRWHEWASRPIRPHLIVRLIAAVYVRRDLPAELSTPGEWLAFAIRYAGETRMRCCLVLSRRIRYWIREDGSYRIEEVGPWSAEAPALRLGRRRFIFGEASGPDLSGGGSFGIWVR